MVYLRSPTRIDYFANTVITRHLVDTVRHVRLRDALADARARRSPLGSPLQWVVVAVHDDGRRRIALSSDPQAREYAGDVLRIPIRHGALWVPSTVAE